MFTAKNRVNLFTSTSIGIIILVSAHPLFGDEKMAQTESR